MTALDLRSERNLGIAPGRGSAAPTDLARCRYHTSRPERLPQPEQHLRCFCEL